MYLAEDFFIVYLLQDIFRGYNACIASTEGLPASRWSQSKVRTSLFYCLHKYITGLLIKFTRSAGMHFGGYLVIGV